MRLDKFLKVSRILKRRTVANNAATAGRVFVNGKTAKPAAQLKIGDVVSVEFGSGTLTFRVLKLDDKATKQSATDLYEVVNG